MNRYAIAWVIPHYQPIVRLSDRKVVMYECLARFINKDGVGVGPADIDHLFDDPEFLWDLLEKTIPSILTQYRGACDTSISINIDPCSLGDRFFYFFEHLFHRHPSFAKFIHFEIAERNINKAINCLAEYVTQIQRMGSQVFLDDFGTGSANIDVLQRVRFDCVKIDGQYLTGAAKTEDGMEKLELIVKLLKIYNTKIVGEHIENERILNIAKGFGIDFGQGHLFGFPRPTITDNNDTLELRSYQQ